MTSLLELELEAKKKKLDQAEMDRGSDSPYVKELKTLSTALEEEDNHPAPESSDRQHPD
jgi:hypothetical protein